MLARREERRRLSDKETAVKALHDISGASGHFEGWDGLEAVVPPLRIPAVEVLTAIKARMDDIGTLEDRLRKLEAELASERALTNSLKQRISALIGDVKSPTSTKVDTTAMEKERDTLRQLLREVCAHSLSLACMLDGRPPVQRR